MAGHIVKWWKHKILGGYHKFSVLQECPTDSEELMYHQVRAQSSCSAPPDLLLVSDRESNHHQQHLKSPISNGTSPSPKRIENSQQQHQPQNTHHNNKENSKKLILSHLENTAATLTTTPSNGGDHHNHHHQQQQQQHNNHHHHHQHRSKITTNTGENQNCEKSKDKIIKNSIAPTAAADQEIHLEEFTCDVSVEGGKSTQPIQFSFTFYDLDGHHGKITKDDIVGIVYTIYESIGKSVVVPHCGSKTINVRLTVSPESKSKQNQQKQTSTDINITQHHHRQHRIRPRKIIKSEDEDEESASEKDDHTKNRNHQVHQTHHFKKKLNEHKKKSKGTENNKKDKEKECCFELNEKLNHLKIDSQSGSGIGNGAGVVADGSGNNSRQNKQEKEQNDLSTCNNLINIDCVDKEEEDTSKESDDGGLLQNNLSVQKCVKHRIKATRRLKKEKHSENHNSSEMRRRSLSVGNECNWRKRSEFKSSRLNTGANGIHFENGNIISQDTVDGDCRLEFRNNGLKRNELIDIIRESMEKNRLCFQSSGKPQASVSPMRHHQYHRQRSNTVSKIPTAINTHIYDVAGEKTQSLLGGCSSGVNNNNNHSSSKHQHYQQHQIYSSPQLLYHQPITSTSFQHSPTSVTNSPLQNNSNSGPHIPIYHQQLAINPAILSAVQNNIQANLEKTSHTKQNLCGYDSFLHAKMCSNNTTNGKSSGSIQNSPNHFHVPNHHHHHPHNSNNVKQTKLSLSKQLMKLSSPYYNNENQQQTPLINLKQQNALNIQESQLQQTTTHGYQRLNSSNQSNGTTTTTITTATTAKKLNTALLNIISPQLTPEEKLCRTIDHVEKWLNEHGASITNISDDKYSKKDVKNYDNLLYVKLNEKFAQQQQQQQQQQHQQQNSQNSTINNSVSENTKLNSNSNIGDNNNKENIRKIYQYHQKLLHQQQQQRNSSALATSNKSNSKSKNKYITIASPSIQTSKITQQQQQQSIQSVAIDPIECENLLNTTASEDDDEEIEENICIPILTTPISPDVLTQNSPLQNTPPIIDDNDTPIIVEDGCNPDESINNDHTPDATTTSITGDNSCNNSSNSLSMIHRYVHEHIHHHYHHFENKED